MRGYLSWHETLLGNRKLSVTNLASIHLRQIIIFLAAKFEYPSYYLGWDIVIDFFYVIVECTRLMLASKANKTASVYAMIWSLVLGCPILLAHSYYITLQTYVLRVDVVINGVAFFIVGAEMVMSALTLAQLFLASRKF